MTIWIRRVSDGKSENYLKLAEDLWELPDLFTTFEKWLEMEATNLDANFDWIADIGFSSRKGASGGGTIISREIMELCLSKNVTIYLSEYDDSDDA